MTNIRATAPSMPLDISHLDVGPPLDDEPRRPSRSLVAYRHEHVLPSRIDDDMPLAELEQTRVEPKRIAPPNGDRASTNVRHMTPRQMLDYSEDLYAAGIITFDDYEALAFQPDLHPHFDRTIGALTGERAQPDRPRDFIRRWEDRLEFAQRYYPSSSQEVRQAFRILEAIKAFPRHHDIFA